MDCLSSPGVKGLPLKTYRLHDEPARPYLSLNFSFDEFWLCPTGNTLNLLASRSSPYFSFAQNPSLWTRCTSPRVIAPPTTLVPSTSQLPLHRGQGFPFPPPAPIFCPGFLAAGLPPAKVCIPSLSNYTCLSKPSSFFPCAFLTPFMCANSAAKAFSADSLYPFTPSPTLQLGDHFPPPRASPSNPHKRRNSSS